MCVFIVVVFECNCICVESHFIDSVNPFSHGCDSALSQLQSSTSPVQAYLIQAEDFQHFISIMLRVQKHNNSFEYVNIGILGNNTKQK